MPKVGKKESKILHDIARKRLKDFQGSPLAEKAREDIRNIKAGPIEKYTNAEDLEREIQLYIDKQKEDKKPLTITGLALAVGLDRGNLLNYGKKEKFYNVINKYRQILLKQVEENLTDKSTFTPGQIFYLKNNYKQDYQDKIDFDGNVNITSLVDLHKLADNIVEGELVEEIPSASNISLQEGTPQEENTFAEEDTR